MKKYEHFIVLFYFHESHFAKLLFMAFMCKFEANVQS